MSKIKLSDLTLREKIGQTFVFKGNFWENVEDWESYLKKNPSSGVWSFGKRCKDINAIVDFNGVDSADNDFGSDYAISIPREMKKYLKVPPIIGADTVSGFVGMSQKPSVMSVGATNRLDIGYKLGACIAEEFKCCGVRWHWSPVADLSQWDAANSRARVFSDDAELLANMCIEFVKGTQEHGVAAGMKHFPGHGVCRSRDTHLASSCNTMTFEEWEKTQGAVYQKIIDSGVYTVMISHSSFPAVDDTKVGRHYIPSTFSKKIVTDLLKEKMGFKGVVVSDDLYMRGCKNCFPREELYINALNAGIDILLGPEMEPDFAPNYIDVIEKAVNDGRVSMERINDACQRVLDLKEKLGLFEENIYEEKYNVEEITKNTAMLAREIAEEAITLVVNERNLLPIDKNKIKNIAILPFAHSAQFSKSMESLKKILENRGFNVSILENLNVQGYKDVAENNDLIIYATFIGPHQPYGKPSFYGDVMKSFFNVLTFGAEKSVCASFGSTNIYYEYFEDSETFINAYAHNNATLEAFVKAIFGEIPFRGKTPFKLIP